MLSLRQVGAPYSQRLRPCVVSLRGVRKFRRSEVIKTVRAARRERSPRSDYARIFPVEVQNRLERGTPRHSDSRRASAFARRSEPLRAQLLRKRATCALYTVVASSLVESRRERSPRSNLMAWTKLLRDAVLDEDGRAPLLELSVFRLLRCGATPPSEGAPTGCREQHAVFT